jgi:hypothetical protein
MHMRRLLIVAMLAITSPVWAQDTVAVSYDLNVYATGATVPSTRVVPASSVTCGLATAGIGDSINPTMWWWQPEGLTTWCRTDDAARLAALPIGSYLGAVIGVNAAGVRGMESPRVPFTRTTAIPPQGPPAVTNLRFSK